MHPPFQSEKADRNTNVKTIFSQKSFEMKKNAYLCGREIRGFESKNGLLDW